MDKKVKQLSITAMCRGFRKELIIPIPAELSVWIEQLEVTGAEEESDPLRFSVEGDKSVQLVLSVQDFRRKF